MDRHTVQVLKAAGYVHQHMPASWEDVGGPENGPKLVGGPAFELWERPEHFIVIRQDEVMEEGPQPPFFDDIPF